MFDTGLLKAKRLREERGELAAEMKAILSTAKAEERSLTQEEIARFDTLSAEATAKEVEFTTIERDAYGANVGGGRIVGSDPQRMARDIVRPGHEFLTSDGRTIRSIAHYEPMPNANPNYSIGRCLQAALTGRLHELQPEERAAMFGGTDTGGGYLLNPELSANVTDLARAASVSIRAGATVVPMETSELLLTRVSGDPTAYWRAETQAVTSTEVTFDRIALRPKTLAAIIPVSIELLEDAANAADVLERTLRNAMGKTLDNAILQGTGASNVPKGIKNQTGITSTSDIGLPADYSHVSSAVGSIYSNNFPGEASELSWISHPRDSQILDNLQDTTNQPMMPTPWVSQLQRFNTTNIDITTTTSLTDTFSIVGDFSQVVVGVRSDSVNVRILDAGTVTDSDSNTWNANTQLMRHIVAYLRADIGILQPGWFTSIEGIQTSST